MDATIAVAHILFIIMLSIHFIITIRITVLKLTKGIVGGIVIDAVGVHILFIIMFHVIIMLSIHSISCHRVEVDEGDSGRNSLGCSVQPPGSHENCHPKYSNLGRKCD